jgi:hypothetical protein
LFGGFILNTLDPAGDNSDDTNDNIHEEPEHTFNHHQNIESMFCYEISVRK